MKRFKFKLEVVLTERKRIEDLRLKEYTLARNILNSFIEALKGLEDRLAKAFEEATKLASLETSSTGEIIAMEAFIAGTKTRIKWKKLEIERGERLTEKKRLEYVAAHQKRQALEKLKERKTAEHKQLERKRELKALDDIYVMRANRLKNEEDAAV